MRAFASSFSAWKELERNEGTKVPHGLVFPLAVVEAIGKPQGLQLFAEEHTPEGPHGFDAVFLSVLDSRCMVDTAPHFARWKFPLRRKERTPGSPLVWAGGQGLHNPLPFTEVADLIVVGDAEDPLPVLLDLWERHGNTPGFLAAAATVPGVYVPAHHDPGEVTIEQGVSDDIGITLREHLTVSLDGSRRIEIARGCKYKCTFCSLGWRTPVRENTAEEVVVQIRRSGKRVHLQAGDAESHSEIDTIRSSLREHGGSDQGWTGRLDSLFENPDQTIPGSKRYAFGVEALSFRLRRALGKGYLTDDRLVSDTVRFFDSIEGQGKGRGAWHMMAGVPTERVSEAADLVSVLTRVNDARRGKTVRNLQLHWQPFQPLPGTPMQWCGVGGGARKLSSVVSACKLPWLPIRQLNGRTDDMAKVCTVLSRSDARGVRLLEALGRGKVAPADAVALTGTTYGPIPTDAPLPWECVATKHPRETLLRAYDVMMRRLQED